MAGVRGQAAGRCGFRGGPGRCVASTGGASRAHLPILPAGMTYTRRGFQLMRDAILAVDDAGELERLRALAFDQWGGDPFHAELEALLDRRAAEIAERAAGGV